MTKINMTELIADREAQDDSNWWEDYDESPRVQRLPAIEAALIEAVDALEQARENLADGSASEACLTIDTALEKIRD